MFDNTIVWTGLNTFSDKLYSPVRVESPENLIYIINIFIIPLSKNHQNFILLLFIINYKLYKILNKTEVLLYVLPLVL